MRPYHKHELSILEQAYPIYAPVRATRVIEFSDGTVIRPGECFPVTGHNYPHVGVFVEHPVRGETLLLWQEIEAVKESDLAALNACMGGYA